MDNSQDKVQTILNKAQRGETLLKEEISFILHLNDKDQIDAVFHTARDLRHSHFGESVFLYGFLYLSTYCRNSCNFCFFRKPNKACKRYRKSGPEIVDAASQLTESGVHLIDLTMGEDPEYYNSGPGGFEKLVNIIESVKSATNLPVMISPGLVPDDVLSAFKEAGATWYACYQETHNRALLKHLRLGQSYDGRLEKKIMAHRLGLLIEEGLISGVGESMEDVAYSISVMHDLDADQVRVMSFIPQKGTPMENRPSPDRQRELLIIAAMRLAFPDRLIPASMDIDGLAGTKLRLNAGANVVTSIVPPHIGLAGVAQSSLDINDSRRSVASVLPMLEQCGLRKGDLSEYDTWINNRIKVISQLPPPEAVA